MKQEDTKRKILEKALELFAEKGYDSVSVGEIATAVGIKAPSLYNHYSGKQAIFDAIFANAVEKYEKYTDTVSVHVQNAAQDLDVFTKITEDMLADKVIKIFTYSLHDKTISRFRRMMTIEQFRSAELSRLYSKRYVYRLTEYHAKLFEGLIKADEIKNEDPETLALMYVSPIITLIEVCDRQPEKETECIEKLKAHVRLFYRTFHISGGSGK